MSTPNLDTIADLIVARLKAGMYTRPYEISNVVRPNQKFNNFVLEPWLCLVQMVELAPAADYEEEGTNPFYRMIATYHAETAVIQPDDDPAPHDQIASYLIWDMAKAITTPATSWHTWEDNALNTRWRPLVTFAENNAIVTAGLAIDVDVSLRSNDPYQIRG